MGFFSVKETEFEDMEELTEKQQQMVDCFGEFAEMNAELGMLFKTMRGRITKSIAGTPDAELVIFVRAIAKKFENVGDFTISETD